MGLPFTLEPCFSRRCRSRDSSMSQQPRFHLAFPVSSLAEARAFYGELLGCPEGRSAGHWGGFGLPGPHSVPPPPGPPFIGEPQTRFAGQQGEQATMFLTDPSGNALEFKAFADEAMIFAK